MDPTARNRNPTMKWPVSFRGTGSTSIWGNSFFDEGRPGTYREVSDADWRGELLPVGAERRRSRTPTDSTTLHRVGHELSRTDT